ncbi:MAG TPA: ribbon-helix-helix domain-containing protein [Candidatus Bipolaricaulis sp.]|nr:ribbon-helix-helix domain-containing protein [Candidatus Bipolaricaulis sp.]MDY0392372.1 ribbon-helix-helix domain-containing protein [Candidatus Bipolaricaulis sp.]HPD07592.1 ribbon-helix-helix domain-containing protein [Candidatus Bipolaricaulis sp.]
MYIEAITMYHTQTEVAEMAQPPEKRKKVTLTLPAGLVADVQALVAEGRAASQSAFVADALAERVRQIQQTRLREEFLRAAADPLFLHDVEETERAFLSADREATGMIPG